MLKAPEPPNLRQSLTAAGIFEESEAVCGGGGGRHRRAGIDELAGWSCIAARTSTNPSCGASRQPNHQERHKAHPGDRGLGPASGGPGMVGWDRRAWMFLGFGHAGEAIR